MAEFVYKYRIRPCGATERRQKIPGEQRKIPYCDEILEVVDEHDRVIGTESRGTIHQLGLMHRSAQVLLFNTAGELFVQKRSMGKDEFPGLWDSSAAGHLAPGESYRDCAVRELEEELGLRLSDRLAELFRFPASEDTGFEHCTVFRCISDDPLTLQAEEIDEGRWIPADDMDRWVANSHASLTPALRKIWRRYRGLQD